MTTRPLNSVEKQENLRLSNRLAERFYLEWLPMAGSDIVLHSVYSLLGRVSPVPVGS
jgi:hypothetical protein